MTSGGLRLACYPEAHLGTQYQHGSSRAENHARSMLVVLDEAHKLPEMESRPLRASRSSFVAPAYRTISEQPEHCCRLLEQTSTFRLLVVSPFEHVDCSQVQATTSARTRSLHHLTAPPARRRAQLVAYSTAIDRDRRFSSLYKPPLMAHMTGSPSLFI
jgi:hypothetical protein